jgi:Fe2+ transport system protein FeoA
MQHLKELIVLSSTTPNQRYYIEEIRDDLLKLKLMEMGVRKGMQIEKVRTAIGRGPLMLKIFPSGNFLALRFEEAKQILVR